jgi:tRNA nucleotidyltransferase (CCA-adding enzyme)
LYSLLRVEEGEMKAMHDAYIEFKKVVAKAMQQLGYEHDLLIYGSSMNGLALRGHSDLDLSLVI